VRTGKKSEEEKQRMVKKQKNNIGERKFREDENASTGFRKRKIRLRKIGERKP